MKKKVNFDKKINFPTMIGEVTSISLDHNLKFINESNIEGDLLLSGKYKLTEASRLEEDFNYKIPTEISLTEKIDLNTSKIDITDFYYEIENEDTMICHVELEIEGLEIIEEEEELERECDGDIVTEEEKEIEIVNANEDDSKEEIIEEVEDKKEDSLFINLNDDNDTYGTFIVYIVRQNETINSIIEKYNTSLEEIEKYNDIKNINIGTKLIIPLLNE